MIFRLVVERSPIPENQPKKLFGYYRPAITFFLLFSICAIVAGWDYYVGHQFAANTVTVSAIVKDKLVDHTNLGGIHGGTGIPDDYILVLDMGSYVTKLRLGHHQSEWGDIQIGQKIEVEYPEKYPGMLRLKTDQQIAHQKESANSGAAGAALFAVLTLLTFFWAMYRTRKDRIGNTYG